MPTWFKEIVIEQTGPVCLRILALTHKVFFSLPSWHNVVDFIVVLLAFPETISAGIVVRNNPEEDKEVREN